MSYLKTLRTDLLISQTSVANILGVSRARLAMCENGSRFLPGSTDKYSAMLSGALPVTKEFSPSEEDKKEHVWHFNTGLENLQQNLKTYKFHLLTAERELPILETKMAGARKILNFFEEIKDEIPTLSEMRKKQLILERFVALSSHLTYETETYPDLIEKITTLKLRIRWTERNIQKMERMRAEFLQS